MNNQSQLATQENPFAVVAKSLCALCALPAVATHDWTSQAARAVSRLSPSGYACVQLVGDIAQSFEVRSSGVCKHGDEAGMRARLERVQSLGFPLTAPMLESGAVMRLHTVNRSWRESVLGRVWGPVGNVEPTIGVVPVGPPSGGLSIVCMFWSGEEHEEVSLEAFASVLGVLGARASVMVGNEKNGEIRWLTVREQEVLDALVRGGSVIKIAEDLGRSRHTVHDHVKSLHRKLHASSRGELVAAALGHGRGGDAAAVRCPMVVVGTTPIAEFKPGSGVPSPRA